MNPVSGDMQKQNKRHIPKFSTDPKRIFHRQTIVEGTVIYRFGCNYIDVFLFLDSGTCPTNIFLHCEIRNPTDG